MLGDLSYLHNVVFDDDDEVDYDDEDEDEEEEEEYDGGTWLYLHNVV